MIVVIEGIDGSGKTSLVKWLSQYYITTKEPGSPHVPICQIFGKIIRFLCRIHLSFLATPFFYLDHFFHYKYFIAEHPDWVIICDRYLPISRRVYGKHLYLKRFLKDPDYVIYLRASAPMAVVRCFRKGEKVGTGRMERYLVKYDSVLRSYSFTKGHWRLAVIDADNRFEYVATEALDIIRYWINEARERGGEKNEAGS